MINNIVFDLGNVLLDFKPLVFLKEKFVDPELIDKLYQIVFKSREWIELDRGTVKEEDVVERLCRKNPGFEEEISEVFSEWKEILRPINGTVDILNELKEKGCYNLYVLSNYHLEAFEVVSHYDFFKHFDGLVISAEINYIKPEPDIYDHLIEKFKIDPEKTLFIDDTRENLDGAEEFGIKTVYFEDPSRLWKELKKLDII